MTRLVRWRPECCYDNNMKYLSTIILVIALSSGVGCYHPRPTDPDYYTRQVEAERDFLRVMTPTGIILAAFVGVAIGLIAGGSE